MTVAPETETLKNTVAPPTPEIVAAEETWTEPVVIEETLADATEEGIIFADDDLYSIEPPLESSLHLQQIMILLQCLESLWQDRQDFYAAGNLTVYYNPERRKSKLFRGPDFFVVLNTVRKHRDSWAVWEEDGKYPNLIVEILSEKTAKNDRGEKKKVYQNDFQTPEYFWFDPKSLEFKGFELTEGVYQALKPNANGLLWSKQLGLYLGVYDSKLRYFTPEEELVPTPEEAKVAEAQRADAVAQQLQAANQRAAAVTQQLEVANQRADAEAQRADTETQRADAEARQRREAEQKLAEMEALLARYREQSDELPE